MSSTEVTRTMKYVETFSFQAPDPLQQTLMELFTFVTKALQLLRPKLPNAVSYCKVKANFFTVYGEICLVSHQRTVIRFCLPMR